LEEGKVSATQVALLPPDPYRWLRLALYLAFFIGMIAAALLTAPPVSTVALIVLVVGSILFGIRELRAAPRRAERRAAYAAAQAEALVNSTDGVGAGLAPPENDTPPRPRFARLRALAGYRSEPLSWLLVVAAIGLMIYSAYLFMPVDRGFDEDLPIRFQALAFAIAGAVALVLAVHFTRKREAFMTPTDGVLAPARANWLVTALGIVLLAIGTEMSAKALNIDFLMQTSPNVQFPFLFFGVALVAWGLSGAPRRLPRIIWWEAALVFSLFGLALFLRVYGIDTLIRGSIDEMHFTDGVRFIWWNPNLELLRLYSNYLPPSMIFSYWDSGLVEILGTNWQGVRMANAIVGAATIPLAYFLGKAFCDRKVGFIAALFLATFPPHLQFSRIAMGQIGDAFFGTMMIMCFARALKMNQRSDWVMGGIAMGLTQYFYEGGRLIFPPLAIGWTILILIFWGRKRFRTLFPGMRTALIAAILIALPVYITMLVTNAPFSSRYNESRIGNDYFSNYLADGLRQDELNSIIRRITDPFFIYVGIPDGTGEFYAGDQPMVLTVFVPLFLLGIAHILARPRAPALILLPWILVASAGNIFISASLMYHRYVMVMPALVMIMAIGLRYTLPMLLPFIRGWGMPNVETGKVQGWRYGVAILGVAAVGVAVVDGWYYFNPFLRDFNISFRAAKPYRDGIDAVLRTYEEIPERVQIVLVGMPEHDRNVPDLFLGFVDRVEPYPLWSWQTDRVTPQTLNDLPRDRGYAFFFEPSDSNAIALIYAYFKNAAPPSYTPYNIPANETLVMVYVPEESTAPFYPDKDPNPPLLPEQPFQG
jgi:4-amino-4-deoxy-L-arabinose transferase-like glycosyltransferase